MKRLTATNLASINITQLKSFPILLPKIEEQIRIQIALNKSIKLLNDTKEKHSKLQSLKTALMQDLLSGKKRVNSLIINDEL